MRITFASDFMDAFVTVLSSLVDVRFFCLFLLTALNHSGPIFFFRIKCLQSLLICLV